MAILLRFEWLRHQHTPNTGHCFDFGSGFMSGLRKATGRPSRRRPCRPNGLSSGSVDLFMPSVHFDLPSGRDISELAARQAPTARR